MRIRIVLFTLLAAATVVAACSSSDELTLNPVTDVAGFTVTTEELGAEPRQELRLVPRVGATQAVTMRQDLEVDVEAEGMSESSQSPTTEFDVTYTVVDTTGGRIRVEGTYDDARVIETPGADPTAIDAIRGTLGAFDGATFANEFTDRGSVISADFAGLSFDGQLGGFLDQMIDSLAESAESMSMPFPVEAVGVGAIWRIEATAEIGGLPIETTSIVELTDLTPDRAIGSLDMTMRFVEGPVDLGGGTVDIVSGEFTGGGPVEWDLVGGITPYFESSMIGTSIMEIEGVRLTQDQRQHIVVAPR